MAKGKQTKVKSKSEVKSEGEESVAEPHVSHLLPQSRLPPAPKPTQTWLRRLSLWWQRVSPHPPAAAPAAASLTSSDASAPAPTREHAFSPSSRWPNRPRAYDAQLRCKRGLCPSGQLICAEHDAARQCIEACRGCCRQQALTG